MKKHPAQNVPNTLREALYAHTKAIADRGAERFRAAFPELPAGWVRHSGTFSPRHDRDMRVFVTIEDDAGDADLFDAIPTELVAQLREITGDTSERMVHRPPTYHVSISRSSHPVSDADIQSAVRAIVPSVSSWDVPVRGESPPPKGATGSRHFAHLFAPVAPRSDAN